jgi:hypothetical protein
MELAFFPTGKPVTKTTKSQTLESKATCKITAPATTVRTSKIYS